MNQLSMEQKVRIDLAIEYADENGKSTEWMLQFAAYESSVSIERVVNYLAEKAGVK
jgi:hypothetical protein